MSPINPYQPAKDSVAGDTVRPRWLRRWLRRFVILNIVLIAIPVLIALVSYMDFLFDIAIRPNNINGDPVTYQHQHFSASGPDWSTVAYFMLPNLVLFAIFRWSIAVRRFQANV